MRRLAPFSIWVKLVLERLRLLAKRRPTDPAKAAHDRHHTPAIDPIEKAPKVRDPEGGRKDPPGRA